MNPTSPTRQSPVYASSPNSSPSSQREPLGPASSYDQIEWHVGNGYSFPVYPRTENEQFRQTFEQRVKNISLQLKTMMGCLSEISPEECTTPWEAFSILVSCLENNLPTQIPLSIFTSASAVTCIANIEQSSPAKKSKRSDSSEGSDLQKKTLTAAKELERLLTSMLAFLQTGLQLNKLKEKNPESNQAYHAFQHTISQRLAVANFVVLDNDEHELAERILSLVNPQGDRYSHEAKIQLLISSTTEFVRKQNALIRDICIRSAYQEKPLPLTGKDLFAICHQHTASIIAPSTNMEELSSWPELIFCYLAQAFLQKKTKRIPTKTDSPSLLAELTHHFPLLTECSSYELKQSAINFLATDFLQFYSTQPINKLPRNINPNARYNELLQCSLSVTKILQGLFIVDTNSCFSPQDFSAFQKYTQELHFPNATAAINSAIQEVASICLKTPSATFSRTILLLDEVNRLLKQVVFQSLALAIVRRKKYKNMPHSEFIPCELIPEELRLSNLLCNYWQEAIRTHNFSSLFSANIPKTAKPLKLLLATSGFKLKKSFHELCYNLLTNIFSDMPLEGSTSALEKFSTGACALKANLLSTHTSRSALLTITMTFIEKTKKLHLCGMLLPIVRQNFQKAQQSFVNYTCEFFLQHETSIPITAETLLAYCNKQYIGTIHVPEGLETLPFWKNWIFLFLAQIFLQKKQIPMSSSNDLTEIINLVQKHFPQQILSKPPFSSKQDVLTKALAELLISMHSEQINPTEQISSTRSVYDSTKYERFLQSVDALNTFIKMCFTLDTNENFSLRTLRIFQAYMNELVLLVGDTETKNTIKGSLLLCIAETQPLDPSPKEIYDQVNKIHELIKKMLATAMHIFVLYNKPYQSLVAQQGVKLALSTIGVDACFPDSLFLSQESAELWKENLQRTPEECSLLQISKNRECISKMYTATAAELTQCFLKLCHKLFVDISKEIILESVTEQSIKTQELQFTETAYLLYPKILLEPSHSQCIFKNLVSFLAIDNFYIQCPQSLTLAIDNFLTTQQIFVMKTYTHLTKHKLELPLTGSDLLAFCNKQYGSETSLPLSLGTLPSWNWHIFYSLAHIFLLHHQQRIGKNFHLSDPKTVVKALDQFFPICATFSLKEQIEILKTRLAEYFMLVKSLAIHDPNLQIDSYVDPAYENFLQSVSTLKELFKMFFTMKTGKTCSAQHTQECQLYIKNLFANEPNFSRQNALQDFVVVCFEEPQPLKQEEPSPKWEDFNRTNFLLENLMELSLALVLFHGTRDTDLTPDKAFSSALQIICSTTSLPSSFINSSAAANALKVAMHAYLSDTLCLRLFDQTQLLSQETKVNPLQTAINEHISGQPCPQMDEHINWLSSMFISTEKELSSLHEKLYLNLKEDVRAAISTKTFPETPSKTFITTVNTYQAAMVSDLSIPTADTTEAAWGQESQITTTPVPEEGEEPLAILWQDIEQILSSEDFTDLFETPEDFTGLLTQEEFQLEEEDSEEKLDS